MCRTALAGMILAVALSAGGVSAQEPAAQQIAAAAAQAELETQAAAETQVAAARPPLRLYLGMWTLHLRAKEKQFEGNQLVGIGYGGYYVATFINSFGERAYSIGLERAPLSASAGPVKGSLGYRAGVVTGYDERFLDFARHTPVLPVLQLRALAEYERAAVEFSYAGVVTSVTLSFRL